MDHENSILNLQVEGPEMRLDKFLAAQLPDFSRSRLQAFIKGDAVQVNGKPVRTASRTVMEGDHIHIVVPQAEEADPEAQNIPINILYEDEDLIVLNKQAGLVTHPGAGNHDQTLVNALLYHCGDSLSGIGGVLRPGIVHRLDKDTSGLMVVAKNDFAHRGLSEQLADRTLTRKYLALILGVPMPQKGSIDKPLGRDPRNRVKMSVGGRGGKEAVTHYRVLESMAGAFSLIECTLESGRTHQIRVHMASIQYPLIGDPLYGPQPTKLRSTMNKAGFEEGSIEDILRFPRQGLHAWRLSFYHPGREEVMSFDASPPDDFLDIYKILAGHNFDYSALSHGG